MSTKRKIIIALVVVFVSVIMLTSSFVFSVRKVAVEATGTLSEFSCDDIKTDSGIKLGQNIFFVNRTKIKKDIEKRFPYAKVASVAAIFPNKIEIKVSERTAGYYIEEQTQTTKNFYILDNELKVLKYLPNLVAKPLAAEGLTQLIDIAALFAVEDGDFIAAPTLLYYLMTGQFKIDDATYLPYVPADIFKSITKDGDDLIFITKNTNCTVTVVDAAQDTSLKYRAFGLFVDPAVPTSQYRDVAIEFVVINGELAVNGLKN